MCYIVLLLTQIVVILQFYTVCYSFGINVSLLDNINYHLKPKFIHEQHMCQVCKITVSTNGRFFQIADICVLLFADLIIHAHVTAFLQQNFMNKYKQLA
jgi:hypothetical protein